MGAFLYFTVLCIGVVLAVVIEEINSRKKRKKALLEAAERIEVKPQNINIKEVNSNMSVDLPSARTPKPPKGGSAINRPSSTANVNVNVNKTNSSTASTSSYRSRDDDYLTNPLHPLNLLNPAYSVDNNDTRRSSRYDDDSYRHSSRHDDDSHRSSWSSYGSGSSWSSDSSSSWSSDSSSSWSSDSSSSWDSSSDSSSGGDWD